MPRNDYDKASRFAAKIDPPAFLCWLLGVPPGSFDFRGWLDTRGVPFPGDPDRTGDTVARLDNPAANGVPWALAVEFQSQPDPDMFGRLLGYLSGLWLTLRPDEERGSRFHVATAVVNLTGVGTASREFRWPEAGLAAQLVVAERNPSRESAAELLDGIEAGRLSRCLLPWVPLLAGGGEPGTIDRWRMIAESEPDLRRRAEFGGLALVFAQKTANRDLWRAKLEDWSVEESPIVNEWIATGVRRDRVASLLDILTDKFGAVPEEVTAAIRGTADLDRLRLWTRAAATSPDLPTFRSRAGL